MTGIRSHLTIKDMDRKVVWVVYALCLSLENGRFIESVDWPENEQKKKSVRQIYPQNLWITLSLMPRNLS